MSIIKWRPYGDLLEMTKRVNRFFDDDSLDYFDKVGASVENWSPVTDIYETKDHYIFKIEVPGLSKDDIKIEFKENVLIIKGEKKEEKEVKKENYHRIESFCGAFSRSFTIPKGIDPKKIEAALQDGILELKVGKDEEKKTKVIPITIK